MEERLARVANILGISDILEKYPSEISIGQKQRISAGRAMITNPQLIFADEPTGALDSKSATELLQYLAEINLKEDATILMVTHDAFSGELLQPNFIYQRWRFICRNYSQWNKKRIFSKNYRHASNHWWRSES